MTANKSSNQGMNLKRKCPFIRLIKMAGLLSGIFIAAVLINIFLNFFTSETSGHSKFARVWEAITSPESYKFAEQKNICIRKLGKLISRERNGRLKAEDELKGQKERFENFKIFYGDVRNFLKNGAIIPASNKTKFVDLDMDGKDELITWGEICRSSRKDICKELSTVRIFRFKDDRLKEVFKVDFASESLESVSFKDLNNDGKPEVVIDWQSTGSAGHGLTTIIYNNKGNYKSYSTQEVSCFRVGIADIDNDGRFEIFAGQRFPRGQHKLYSVFFSLVYHWDGEKLVYAPRHVYRMYYKDKLIPGLRRANLEDYREGRACKRLEIRGRKVLIRIAKRLLNEPLEDVLTDLDPDTNEYGIGSGTGPHFGEIQKKAGCPLEIHTAAQDGDLAMVAALLRKNKKRINARDEAGWTPLHNAIFFGHQDIVRMLISKGADVATIDVNGMTPLHEAVMFGQKDIAMLLISRGADIRAQNYVGWTPLYFAVNWGRKDLAKLLISRSADVNIKDIYDRTMLHMAARKGQYEIAELLISYGAKVNARMNKQN